MSALSEALTQADKQRILTHGPIGHWQTVAGTADVLMRAHLLFRPDGTGEVDTYSALSGTESPPFCWSMREPGRLALRHADVPDGPDEWEHLQLAFRMEHTDVGSFDVLGDHSGKGFWFLLSPLGFVDVIPGD